MARSSLVSVENNFVNGLVTEATGLNFPENAVSDTINVRYDTKGVAESRKGFDYEDGWDDAILQADDNSAVQTYRWEAASGNGSITLTVVQIGNILYFFKSDAVALSPHRVSEFVDIRAYQIAGAPEPLTEICQFASGIGRLVVTNRYCEPFFVEYNPETEDITSTAISITTRDLKGTGRQPEERGGVMTNARRYDLINQGWSDYHIDKFTTDTGVIPSDFDVWWLFKNAQEEFAPFTTAASISRGNSPAPKGHFVLGEFFQDRALAAGSSDIPVQSAGIERPSCCAFFSGRIWYSGVSADGYNSKIYFSQIIETSDQFGKCHQLNDPTSESAYDLYPSDGGVIVIPELGKVLRLETVETGLLVFATNGIWAITGSSAIGFTANDYTVRFVSDVKCLSPSSFIRLNGMPCWWSSESIYAIKNNPSVGSIEVVSVSEAKIKRFYKDIPEASKVAAQGAYDPVNRIAQWVYRSTTSTTLQDQYTYDSVLCYNALSGAFYPYRFNATEVAMKGITVSGGQARESGTAVVTALSGDDVTANDLENVTSDIVRNYSIPFVFKYLTLTPSYWTFSEEKSDSTRDWVQHISVPGENPTYGYAFDCYFYTGYQIRGDSLRDFQKNYIKVFVDPSLTGYVILDGWWDYANSSEGKRVSSPQYLYFPDPYVTYASRRTKIRGSGKALQLKFDAGEANRFRIIGWAGWETVNSEL